MSKPKVLIHVSGGIAYWSAMGDVDVVVVDEDNIKAGDPPVELPLDWQPVVSQSLDLREQKLIFFTLPE
jgi:hypothetical protein